MARFLRRDLKMATWDDFEKRFGIACFLRAEPLDPDGEGNASQLFDSIDEVDEWAEKALKAGRFKYLVCWDSVSGFWEWSHVYFPEPRTRKKPRGKK
jgi:hypothetical protein